MSNANWFAGAALGCCVALAGAGFGYGQRPTPPPTPPTPPPPPATRPVPPAAPETRPTTETRTTAPADTSSPRTMRAKDVLGSKISLKGGTAAGTVEDIIFDEDGGIDYLVVTHDGKDVLVPWDAAKFDWANRTATVDVTQEQFSQVPTYAPTELPANVYEPSFQTKIYGYYNLKPRQERRIERRER